MNGAVRVAREAVASVRTGRPLRAGNLGLVPLLGGGPTAGYRLGASAIADGSLRLGEVGEGHVIRLLVANAGALPALLVAGEHLEGAKQHRVLNASVLVPPRSKLQIPVSCVEEGRWGYRGRRAFAPAADGFAFASLRRSQHERVVANLRGRSSRDVDQAEVWREVGKRHAALGLAPSPTGAMNDTFVGRRSELSRALSEAPRPGDGASGVLVCIAGRPMLVDLFDHPATLRALWPRLVSGYAVDALGAPWAEPDPAVADGFLSGVFGPDAELTWHDGVGLGVDVVATTDRTAATALTWESAVVHLTAFTTA